jgi:hypothetical protein
MGLGGVLAFAFLVVFLVFLKVAFEPDHFGIAFEGEDVGRDAVEEPAVMRNHHRATRERQQRIFEGAQCFDIEIVGRLVEQQHVASGLQNLRQVDPVAFAAGQIAYHLLLLHTLEIKSSDVTAG